MKSLAGLDRERRLWTAGAEHVVGVDEVGIGPLCGAVVAAAVSLPANVDSLRLVGVRDSKAVPTVAEREALAEAIRNTAVRTAIGAASPREIERLNVRGATALAMRRALDRLGPYDHALVDGRPIRGLVAPNHTFIVRGDAECLSIACASILAKVTRDRLMRRLAARYPGYGWEHNVGYPTPEHLRALRQLGPTRHHRQHFRPVLQYQLEFGRTDGSTLHAQEVRSA